MREILFRGKRIDNGEWVEGYLIHDKHDGLYRIVIKLEYSTGTYIVTGFAPRVNVETVGQYTGLTDKNGKRIFEGDIFKFPDEIFESYYTSCGAEYNSWEVENYGVVGFCDYSGRFDFVEYKFNENVVEADLHENHNIEFYEFIRGLEVIGNIHDNPELLKGESE